MTGTRTRDEARPLRRRARAWRITVSAAVVLAIASLVALGWQVSARARSPLVTAEQPGGDAWAGARAEMVRAQISARGVKSPAVLAALERVPRHLFVPEDLREVAYEDRPLPIGHEQTISQPYIVGLMTELLELDGDDKVLEIGTGSGYQAAVLAEIARVVYTIEIVAPLADESRARLAELGYENVLVRTGDGYRGWPEQAPFDAIILTAAPPEIPKPLIDQLAVGGVLVAPVGDGQYQELKVIARTANGLDRKSVAPVRFVPMTGEAQEKP